MKMRPTEPETTERVAPAGAPRLCALPNGVEVAYQSRAELGHFYEDIFEKQVYVRHGVALREGDCVFDVGANIGLFTLFAHRKANGLRVYAFEPAPPLFRLLSFNVARHGVNARLFNCGVSDGPKTAEFTFYPRSSGMSSFYADEREEKEALRAIMLNELRAGAPGMEELMRHADDLLEARFRSETFECRLRPLSEVIAEERVERIDLLKVDVQKSELDVLEGLSEPDWPKVRQIVIEVHDLRGRLAHITGLLERRGFRVVAEQDGHYEGSVLYNLYAVRPPAPDPPAGREAKGPPLEEIRERARRQEAALNRRKQLSGLRRKES